MFRQERYAIPASLADGQLPNTKGTLYTVPAGKAAIINFIHFYNTTGGNLAVNVYLKRSGSTSRQIDSVSVAANSPDVTLLGGENLELSAGDVIEGDAASAASVDYIISGFLVDVH